MGRVFNQFQDYLFLSALYPQATSLPMKSSKQKKTKGEIHVASLHIHKTDHLTVVVYRLRLYHRNDCEAESILDERESFICCLRVPFCFWFLCFFSLFQ